MPKNIQFVQKKSELPDIDNKSASFTVRDVIKFALFLHSHSWGSQFREKIPTILQLILILPYTDVRIVLYTQCFTSFWKNFTGNSGGIWTHDLLLTSADVLTSRPLSLPDDDWWHLMTSLPDDVCTSKQEVVGLNPARVACEGFFTDTRKALSIQCYTHVGVVGQN